MREASLPRWRNLSCCGLMAIAVAACVGDLHFGMYSPQCFEVSQQPIDQNGKTLGTRSILRSGTSLEGAQLKAVQDAIDIVAGWERAYRSFRPLWGSKPSSQELRDLVEQGGICVETLAFTERAAASTWAKDYNYDDGGIRHEGQGAPAIHIRSEYLPVDNEVLGISEQYKLASILLHEAGHLQQTGDVQSVIEKELPVYGWVISQLGLVLGDPKINQDEKDAVRDAIVSAAEYCQDAKPLGVPLPIPITLPVECGKVIQLKAAKSEDRLLILDDMGGIHAWRTIDPRSLWKESRPSAHCLCLNGETLYVADAKDGLLVFDAAQGKKRNDVIRVLASVSSDPSVQYVADDAALWYVSSGKLGATGIGGRKDPTGLPALERAHCLALDGKGSTLAVAHGTGKIALITTGNRKQRSQLFGDGKIAATLVFAGDNTTLVAGCSDGTIQVWDTAKDKGEFQTIGKHATRVRSLSIDPSGRWIASCDESGEVAIWSVRAAARVHTVPESGQAVEFLQKGTKLAVGTGNLVKLWDLSGLR